MALARVPAGRRRTRPPLARPESSIQQRYLSELGPVDLKLLRHNGRFLHSSVRVGSGSGYGRDIDVPIGEYGRPLATALLRAAQTVDWVLINRMNHDLQQHGMANKMLLARQAFPVRSVTVDASGRLHVSPELLDLIGTTRAYRREGGGVTVKDTGAGCPLAIRGLEVLGEDGPVTKSHTYIKEVGDEFIRLARRYLAEEELFAV